MASALLASRNDPHYGEGKVYTRQNPNFTPSSSCSNPNKKQQIYNNHHPPTTQKNHHGRFQQHHQQKQMHSNNLPDAPPPLSISNDSSSHNRNPNFIKDQNRRGGGGGESTKNRYVKFNISEYSKKELKDLKRRFISELEQIRDLSTQIESRQSSRSGGDGGGFSSCPGGSVSSNFSLPPTKKGGGGGLKRPFPFADDTKRGPSMAETKLIGNMMKKCGTMLKNLMKHRHGYIFNEQVDPIKENLLDYNSVIRKPMDLGTVKQKLAIKLYKKPEEFAADVRLTFNNALIYNPKGHEVYVLAQLLLKQFNESFEPAHEKFENDMKKLGKENGIRNSSIVVPIGISDDERERPGFVRQKVLPSSTTPDRMRTVTPDRIMHKPPPFRGNSNPQSSKQLLHPPLAPPAAPPQPVMPAADPALPGYHHQQAVKQMSGGIGRPWSGKQPKPKAKDTNKRDMSHSEKQTLGDDLQNLPLDKLDQALQIIRKRDPNLCQVGDEIELDFEAMDIETLWELDRFVGNYKKMLSKMRKQSLSGGSGGNQQYAAVEGNKSPMAVEMPEVAAVKNRKAENIGMEEDVDIGEDMPTSNFPPVEIEKDAGYASDSKSGDTSGSSSSDDDSSSNSDSDSGSSSGSDSAQSPFIESKANKPNDGFD